MIRIIDRSNSEFYAKTLRQQFANRHAVFVEEQGWREFEVAPGIEKDTYDNEHAIYAVCLDAGGDAIGGMRFYPTTLPHMISESFPHLVDGDVIQQDDVYEVTRFHLHPAHRGKGPWFELMLAFQEVGLELGASGLTAIMRVLRLPNALQSGLSVRPLGEPQLIDGVPNFAVFYDVGQTVYDRMSKRLGVTQSVLELNHLLARRA